LISECADYQGVQMGLTPGSPSGSTDLADTDSDVWPNLRGDVATIDHVSLRFLGCRRGGTIVNTSSAAAPS
jgi:NADP-dependent 3-hydroxy acid dehydrogenase YdfG